MKMITFLKVKAVLTALFAVSAASIKFRFLLIVTRLTKPRTGIFRQLSLRAAIACDRSKMGAKKPPSPKATAVGFGKSARHNDVHRQTTRGGRSGALFCEPEFQIP
jgi:hypothetical protein